MLFHRHGGFSPFLLGMHYHSGRPCIFIMGRYYNGDIDGRFWFGVQDSNDADHFGIEGTDPENDYELTYKFEKHDLEGVKGGLQGTVAMLGVWLDHLDAFFAEPKGYSTGMIADFMESRTGKRPSEELIDEKLELYARYGLGKKIRDCIEEVGKCYFRAEC